MVNQRMSLFLGKPTNGLAEIERASKSYSVPIVLAIRGSRSLVLESFLDVFLGSYQLGFNILDVEYQGDTSGQYVVILKKKYMNSFIILDQNI